MQKINSHCDSLGSETYDVLGFESKDELNKEIKKLIQIRSEFVNNSEIISN